MHRYLIFIIAAMLTSASTLAAESPVYTGLLSNTGAGGYDTVSYFEEGEPTKGSADYTTEYQGATWRFASAQKHWSIKQGKLYLNYNQSVQDTWLKSPEEFIVQADANWPNVLE